MNKATNSIDMRNFNNLKKINIGSGGACKDNYLNIDFDSNDKAIYSRIKTPELIADITTLIFDENSLEEIYSSHWFEHNFRHHAVILLSRFNKWLQQNGKLNLLMPDANACMNEFINANYRRKKELIRHMAGSHEDETWSIHKELYFNENLKEMLFATGFDNFIFKNVGGQWPYIEVRCEKIRKPNIALIENYLHDYSPDVVGYPNTLLVYWMNKIKEELENVI